MAGERRHGASVAGLDRRHAGCPWPDEDRRSLQPDLFGGAAVGRAAAPTTRVIARSAEHHSGEIVQEPYPTASFGHAQWHLAPLVQKPARARLFPRSSLACRIPGITGGLALGLQGGFSGSLLGNRRFPGSLLGSQGGVAGRLLDGLGGQPGGFALGSASVARGSDCISLGQPIGKRRVVPRGLGAEFLQLRLLRLLGCAQSICKALLFGPDHLSRLCDIASFKLQNRGLWLHPIQADGCRNAR
jgi:hypothetical protein